VFSARQSTVSSLAVCPRRTYFDITREGDFTVGYSEATADLGAVFHAVAAETMRTLRQQGETQMPTQEGMEICWETYAASNITLPPDEREALRILVLRLVERRWSGLHRALVEGTDLDEDPNARLRAQIVCQDGVTREFTGRPDLVVLNPPDEIVIVDYKTGWQKPREPRQKPIEGEVVMGKEYLSDRGHAQLDGYGLLGLLRYLFAQRAVLREYHLRSGQVREAVLGRDELEHVEREIGIQLQQLDRGLSEGEGSKVWKPRAGKQCARACPVAKTCPIPKEQRGRGAIETTEDADAAAAAFVVADAQRQQLRDALKARWEFDGRPALVGDGTCIRWDGGAGGAFEIADVDDSTSEPDDDLASTFEAAARKATA
jgi:hypothetical protein